MIVPHSRLLFWVALLVGPSAALAGLIVAIGSVLTLARFT